MFIPGFIAAAFKLKRSSRIALMLLLGALPVSASFGQTGKVNSYLPDQVKGTAITGAILVADNMTNWLYTPVAASANVKPVPKKSSKYTPIRSQTATRTKNNPLPKTSKRSS